MTAPEQGQETHNPRLSGMVYQTARCAEAARLVLHFLVKLDKKPVELALGPDSEI